MKHVVVFLSCVMAVMQGVTAAAETRLIIWTHWGNEAVKVDFMNATAHAFTEQTGIEIEMVWKPKMELMEDLALAYQESVPDVMYLDPGFSNPRIVNSLLDLRELQFSAPRDPSWQLGNIDAAQGVFLPIEGISHAIYYNKEVFARAGINVPEGQRVTAQEFFDIIVRLREAGITPIAEGSADRVVKIGIPIMNTIFRVIGPEKMAQLLRGEINFSEADVVEALTFWKQIVDIPGYDQNNVLEKEFVEGIHDMVDGNAAISFCGTYIYGKYGDTERDHGQVGVLDWFTVDNGEGNEFYEMSWGAGFGINRYSAHLPEAKQFLEFLMTPLAAELWLTHVQVPYPVIISDPPQHSLYSELLKQREGQSPSPCEFTADVFASRAANSMWEDVTRRFIVGEHTVEQFVNRMNSRLQ